MRAPRQAAHLAIRFYQLTLSSLVGRQCRHWPSCSEYTDVAIARHGLWPGGWMGLARICRCGPLGTHGIDLVPEAIPERAAWYRPWAYGHWRGTLAPPVCEDVTEAVARTTSLPLPQRGAGSASRRPDADA